MNDPKLIGLSPLGLMFIAHAILMPLLYNA